MAIARPWLPLVCRLITGQTIFRQKRDNLDRLAAVQAFLSDHHPYLGHFPRYLAMNICAALYGPVVQVVVLDVRSVLKRECWRLQLFQPSVRGTISFDMPARLAELVQ